MEQYILSVMLVGIVGSVVSILAPEGGLKDHVRLAIGIVTVAVCILPLMSIITNIGSFDIEQILGESQEITDQDYEEILKSELKTAEIENLREGIKSMLEKKYGISADECYVSVMITSDNNGERKLERIFINLYGESIWKNTTEIEQYLGELFNCEIVCAVG